MASPTIIRGVLLPKAAPNYRTFSLEIAIDASNIKFEYSNNDSPWDTARQIAKDHELDFQHEVAIGDWIYAQTGGATRQEYSVEPNEAVNTPLDVPNIIVHEDNGLGEATRANTDLQAAQGSADCTKALGADSDGPNASGLNKASRKRQKAPSRARMRKSPRKNRFQREISDE